MVKKKLIKKTVSGEGYEDLYINLNNVRDKRSNILMSIKNSLFLQEEYEQISDFRKKKAYILKEIKKTLNDVNSDYQELRKFLPNVKGIISYTEKELNELDSQINTLKNEVKIDQKEVIVEEDLKQKLIREFELNKQRKEQEDGKVEEKKVEIKKVVKKTIPAKELTKLDRIKNNLQVIESKIGKL